LLFSRVPLRLPQEFGQKTSLIHPHLACFAAAALVGRTRLSCARQRHAPAAKAARRHCSSSSAAQATRPPRPPPSGAPPPKQPRKASLFSGYSALLESRPLATKAATSAAIGERGDSKREFACSAGNMRWQVL